MWECSMSVAGLVRVEGKKKKLEKAKHGLRDEEELDFYESSHYGLGC